LALAAIESPFVAFGTILKDTHAVLSTFVVGADLTFPLALQKAEAGLGMSGWVVVADWDSAQAHASKATRLNRKYFVM
jgi:hypothetical protein